VKFHRESSEPSLAKKASAAVLAAWVWYSASVGTPQRKSAGVLVGVDFDVDLGVAGGSPNWRVAHPLMNPTPAARSETANRRNVFGVPDVL
jgi:hypothetical protein